MKDNILTLVIASAATSTFAATTQPNVLLIMADQHNADVLGFMGHPDVKTPNLDKLVEDGVFYTRSYCQAGISVPSRASLVTGQYCTDNHVLSNDDKTPISGFYYTTLQQAMSGEGYITASMGKRHLPMGYELGFDKAATTISPQQDPSDENYTAWIKKEGYAETHKKDFVMSKTHEMSANIAEMPLSHRTSTYARNKSIEFMESARKSGKPFFCWTSFIFPHQPYCPIPQFLDQYDQDKITLPESLYQDPSDLPQLLARQRKQEKSPWCLGLAAKDVNLYRRYITYYYALVTEVDYQIGELVKYLKEKNLYDNTIIVYVSDHGDFVGSHGMIEKCAAGHNVYESTLRIPLVVKPQKSLGAKVGERDDLVGMIDIYPTILELTGAKNQVEGLDGLSLASNVKSGKAVDREYIISENHVQQTVITRDFKYGEWRAANSPNINQLFSYVDDPTEINNLIKDAKYADKITQMRGYLNEFQNREISFWDDLKFSYANPNDDNTKVTSNITLPTEYKGCAIKWSSSDGSIISHKGVVNIANAVFPYSLIKLTAEIENSGEKESCNFAFRVVQPSRQKKN